MEHDLFLRPCVIGGETKPDDYSVIWDGLTIGRIYRYAGSGAGDRWAWSAGLSVIPQQPRWRGLAGSLKEAKEAFRRAWDEIRPELTYDNLKEARDRQADRSRPWHRE
jgi:hypothetical protein